MTAIGWQPDGSYVPCPDCLWAPPPPDPRLPGIAITVLPKATTHHGDCPRVQFLTLDEKQQLLDDLAEMDRVRRRGAAEARNFVIY